MGSWCGRRGFRVRRTSGGSDPSPARTQFRIGSVSKPAHGRRRRPVCTSRASLISTRRCNATCRRSRTRLTHHHPPARRSSRRHQALQRSRVLPEPSLRHGARRADDLPGRLPPIPAGHAVLLLELCLESHLRGGGGRVGGPLPAEHVRPCVFARFGLATRAPDRTDSLIPGRTQPYDRDSGGSYRIAPAVDTSYQVGGSGFVSTAEDLVTTRARCGSSRRCRDRRVACGPNEAVGAVGRRVGQAERAKHMGGHVPQEVVPDAPSTTAEMRFQA